jgi:hypothetical protein
LGACRAAAAAMAQAAAKAASDLTISRVRASDW